MEYKEAQADKICETCSTSAAEREWIRRLRNDTSEIERSWGMRGIKRKSREWREDDLRPMREGGPRRVTPLLWLDQTMLREEENSGMEIET
jgi:hypothetical protein